MIPLIESSRDALIQLCRQYHVRQLDLFGSAATGRSDAQANDLDFLVEFEPDSPMGPFRQYMGLLEDLKTLFGRDVDLVEAPAMKNPYFIKSVNATRVSLYAA
jgi:predicted nucleotidyltransferase